MARVGVLQHFWCENAGIFEPALIEAGHEVTTIPLFDGVAVPGPDAYDAWLVMGGPMNVDETDKHPFLGAGRDLLAELIRRDVPILGICLGAQLIARACGVSVYARRPKEIGLFDIKLTDAGGQDPLLGPLAPGHEVFQWHGDTFDLPDGAQLLARSDRYPHQAFRLGQRVYALQFHLETTESQVRRWAELWRKELEDLGPQDAWEHNLARLEGSLARQNALARKLVQQWVNL